MKSLKGLASAVIVAYSLLGTSAAAEAPKIKAVLKSHDFGRNVYCLAFSPDGRTLATGGDNNELILWDLAAGKERFVCKGHTDEVWSVAFSPDGRLVASGSNDDLIKLWDVTTGKEKATLKGHS